MNAPGVTSGSARPPPMTVHPGPPPLRNAAPVAAAEDQWISARPADERDQRARRAVTPQPFGDRGRVRRRCRRRRAGWPAASALAERRPQRLVDESVSTPGPGRAGPRASPRRARAGPGRSSERTTCGGDRPARSARGGSRGLAPRPACRRRRRAPTGRHRLDLDHDREDHRPALGPLVQVPRQAVLDLRLEQARSRWCGRRACEIAVHDPVGGPAMIGSFSVRRRSRGSRSRACR